MKNQTIRLRKQQLNKIFPDEFTKVREEDLLTKAVENKNNLNPREFNALANIKGELHNKRNREHYEFYAKRKKRSVELIPFD